MNVIKSLVCTLEELGSLPRAEWHVKIRYHLPGQKFMGFGRVIFSWTFSLWVYLHSILHVQEPSQS